MSDWLTVKPLIGQAARFVTVVDTSTVTVVVWVALSLQTSTALVWREFQSSVQGVLSNIRSNSWMNRFLSDAEEPRKLFTK